MSARSDIKGFPPKGEYGFCGKFLTVYIIGAVLESGLLDIVELLVFSSLVCLHGAAYRNT